MRKLSTLVLTATILSAPAMAADVFQKFDMNSDGQISSAELNNNFLGNVSGDVFASYDTSKDGYLSQAEFKKFMDINMQVAIENQKELSEAMHKNDVAQKQAAQANAAIKKHNLEKLKNTADFNAQPKVKYTLDFIVFDLNRDKQVDISEFNRQLDAVMDSELVYGSYDENKDGKLNIEEFKRFVNSDPAIPVEVSSKR